MSASVIVYIDLNIFFAADFSTAFAAWAPFLSSPARALAISFASESTAFSATSRGDFAAGSSRSGRARRRGARPRC